MLLKLVKPEYLIPPKISPLVYNTSDIFWRKGLTNEATNWLNVGIASHFHLNR
jgi:hypothetical protein